MTLVATVLVVLVALLHVSFALLEMVLWTTPRGRATFGLDRDFARESRSLAANQGLYNLFLVAGLVWGLLAGPDLRTPLLLFFLGCVIVAGLFGAATVNRRIVYVQAAPAVVALLVVLLSR